jgi:hypothetical protein
MPLARWSHRRHRIAGPVSLILVSAWAERYDTRLFGIELLPTLRIPWLMVGPSYAMPTTDFAATADCRCGSSANSQHCSVDDFQAKQTSQTFCESMLSGDPARPFFGPHDGMAPRNAVHLSNTLIWRPRASSCHVRFDDSRDEAVRRRSSSVRCNSTEIADLDRLDGQNPLPDVLTVLWATKRTHRRDGQFIPSPPTLSERLLSDWVHQQLPPCLFPLDAAAAATASFNFALELVI